MIRINVFTHFCVLGVLLLICDLGGSAAIQMGYGPFVKDKHSIPSEELQSHIDTGDIIDLDEGGFDIALSEGPFSSASKHAEDTREIRFAEDELTATFHDDSDNVVIGGGQEGGEIFTPVPLVMESLKDVRNETGEGFESDDEDEEVVAGSGSGTGAIVIEIEDATGKYNNTKLEGADDNNQGVHVEMLASKESGETHGETKGEIHGETHGETNRETHGETHGETNRETNGETHGETHGETNTAGNLATDLFQDFMQDSHMGMLTTTQPQDLPPFCEELANVTWTPWSPWMQAGDVDIRFRRCPVSHGHKANLKQCDGDYFEVRKCTRRDETMCRTTSGDITEQFNVGCSGLDLNDVQTIEELRSPQDRKDNCEYTLYDMTYNMAIGEPVTTDTLMTSDPHMWCLADDKFVAFHTPNQKCLDNLNAFCKSSQTCKYDKDRKKLKNKGDLHKECWKEFVLGGKLPVGIPDKGGNQMICQRFGKESKLGKALSSKKTHFATLYDVKSRMPIMSMVTVRNMGDEKWPRVPYMIERGLINEDTSVVSWFFKDKKKGIIRPDEISSNCGLPTCTYGERQALVQDYEHSGYRIVPLLPPDLIGGDIGARLATFTMTNTAPMEPTVFARWRDAVKLVRKFAIDECHLPKQFAKDEERRTDGHELPELYLMAGTAAKSNHVELIGNDVVVPDVFWMSVCCAQGANVSSFGIYTYNQFEQQPTVVSINDLHILLQSEFYGNIDHIDVDLYPAFSSICSALENDISYRKQIL